MLVYDKIIAGAHHLFGTMGRTPSDTDRELVYLDRDEQEIILVEGDKYGDGKHHDIIRKSDGKFVDVYIDDVESDELINIIPGWYNHVPKKAVVAMNIQDMPTKVNYEKGEKFQTAGLSIFVTYEDGTTAVLTNGFTVTPANNQVLNDVGSLDLTVTYRGFTDTATGAIFVRAIENIVIATLPDVVTYMVGAKFDTTGLTIKVNYNDSTSEIKDSGFTTVPANGATLTEADTSVVVKYKGFEASFEIDVKAVDHIAITHGPDKTTYAKGEAFNATGIKVTAYFTDGSTEVYTTGFTTVPVDGTILNTAGAQQLKVAMLGKTATLDNAFFVKALASLEVQTLPTKVTYIKGEVLDLTGLVVVAHYNDSTSEVTAAYTTTPADGSVLNTLGNRQVKVTSTADLTIFVNFEIVVRQLTNIIMTHQPTKLGYSVGEAFEIDGVEVKTVWTDGSQEELDIADCELSPEDGEILEEAGTFQFVVTYMEKTCSCDYMVIAGDLLVYYGFIDVDNEHKEDELSVAQFTPDMLHSVDTAELASLLHYPAAVKPVNRKGKPFIAIKTVDLQPGVTTPVKNTIGSDKLGAADPYQITVDGEYTIFNTKRQTSLSSGDYYWWIIDPRTL